MRFAVVLALAISFAPASASGAPVAKSGVEKDKLWFTDDRGTRFTIYRNLIDKKGASVVQAWVETKMPLPVKTGSGMVKSLKSLEEFDCSERLTRTMYIASYDADGKSLDSTAGDQVRTPIVPGSVAELELALICADAGYQTKNSFDPHQ